jgi:hypothetical protein
MILHPPVPERPVGVPAPSPAPSTTPIAEAVEAADRAGIRRVRAVGWRDLDHPDAGGAEIHLDEVLRRWAAAGIDVSLRTARVPHAPRSLRRNGYGVERRGGPMTSLLRTPLAERRARGDAMVEAWHGINFCGPLWIDGPRLAIVHHVHALEFHYVLPDRLPGSPGTTRARSHRGSTGARR